MPPCLAFLPAQASRLVHLMPEDSCNGHPAALKVAGNVYCTFWHVQAGVSTCSSDPSCCTQHGNVFDINSSLMQQEACYASLAVCMQLCIHGGVSVALQCLLKPCWAGRRPLTSCWCGLCPRKQVLKSPTSHLWLPRTLWYFSVSSYTSPAQHITANLHPDSHLCTAVNFLPLTQLT